MCSDKMQGDLILWIEGIVSRAISVPPYPMPFIMVRIHMTHYETYHVLLRYSDIKFCRLLGVFDSTLLLLPLISRSLYFHRFVGFVVT